MRTWLQRLGAMAAMLVVAGCATPPPHVPEYAATASRIKFAAASVEFEQPVTLPPEPALQGSHPVDFYVGIALERNPGVLAARRAVAAQAQVIPQVTALDDPMVTNTFWPIPEHSPQYTIMGRMPYALMVSQDVPWFGKLRVRGEVAEQEARMALARLAQSELRVVEEVRLAYYDIYFNQRAIEITLGNRRLLEDLLQIADARYRTGEASQQDVLRAEVELDRLDERLIGLRQAHQEAQADLASLLHANPDAQPGTLSELERSSVPAEIERLYDLAVRCRPELQEQMAALVREQRNEELARLRYYPDVTLGFGWDVMTTSQAVSPTADGMDNFAFSVGFNIPLWRDKLRAGVNEAQQRVVENARRYDAERDDTFRQIRRLMVQARALEEQIRLFRDNIIPRASQALHVSIADYRVGRIDFLTLIDNWTQLLMFQVQLVRLEASLKQTLASLERAVGCALAEANPPAGMPAAAEAELLPPGPIFSEQ